MYCNRIDGSWKGEEIENVIGRMPLCHTVSILPLVARPTILNNWIWSGFRSTTVTGWLLDASPSSAFKFILFLTKCTDNKTILLGHSRHGQDCSRKPISISTKNQDRHTSLKQVQELLPSIFHRPETKWTWISRELLLQLKFIATGSRVFTSTLNWRREKALGKNWGGTQVLLICKQLLKLLDHGSLLNQLLLFS